MVELHLEMTPAMISCQTALLDLIDGCVKELKLGNAKVRRYTMGSTHIRTWGNQ